MVSTSGTLAAAAVIFTRNQIASTSDGRVAAFVEDDGNITFAMGPNDEGKVHHVTVQDDLNAAVVSTIDRTGGPPGTVSNS